MLTVGSKPGAGGGSTGCGPMPADTGSVATSPHADRTSSTTPIEQAFNSSEEKPGTARSPMSDPGTATLRARAGITVRVERLRRSPANSTTKDSISISRQFSIMYIPE
ncbi:hypothetical protein [Rhodocyclus tenuis]|nr:hypothetical protein [Rhodocyclus tenuis]